MSVLKAETNLDVAVAKAMGIEVIEQGPLFAVTSYWVVDPSGYFNRLPCYSTDPAACALAKQWLRRNGGWCVDCDEYATGRPFTATSGDLGVASYATEEEAIARLVLAVAEATE